MEIDSLPGAAAVIGWFGYMPSFHEAEVIELDLCRQGMSSLSVQCWHTTNQLDSSGAFTQDKHAIVTFKLADVGALSLSGFNHENVISGIEIEQLANSFRLKLLPSYGLFGLIEAREISLEIKPGKPVVRETEWNMFDQQLSKSPTQF